MIEVPELPAGIRLALSPNQVRILQHVKALAINERLNIAADLNNPLELVRGDIYCRAKLELLEDLLQMDELLQQQEAAEPQK
jgi:hypothetical protein